MIQGYFAIKVNVNVTRSLNLVSFWKCYASGVYYACSVPDKCRQKERSIAHMNRGTFAKFTSLYNISVIKREQEIPNLWNRSGETRVQIPEKQVKSLLVITTPHCSLCANSTLNKQRPVLCHYAPPLKKEGHIALHMSVGMSVGRYVGRSVCRSVCRSVGMSVAFNLVQLITQERFAPEASNLVGR